MVIRGLLVGLGLIAALCMVHGIEVTDASGAKVVVTDTSRIVSLGGTPTEIVFALDAGSRVVGTDISSLYPADKVVNLPKLGYLRQISAEGVLSLRPTIIIATEDLGPPPVVQQLRRAGIPLLIVPIARTPEAAQSRVRLIAKALGAEAAAARVIATMDQDLARAAQVIKQAAATGAKPKVLFIYARGAGTIMAAGTESEADAVIRLAGGQNAVSGYTGYRPLTAEAAVAANPDLILFTSLGLESLGAKGAAAIPALAQSSAVKNGRVLALDDLYLLGFGPRLGSAVADLAKLMYQGR